MDPGHQNPYSLCILNGPRFFFFKVMMGLLLTHQFNCQHEYNQQEENYLASSTWPPYRSPKTVCTIISKYTDRNIWKNKSMAIVKQKLLCVSKLNREGNPARHGYVWMGSQCKLPKLVHENCQDYYMPRVIFPYFSLSYMGLCSVNSSADNRKTDSRAKHSLVQWHGSLAPW